MRAMPEAGAASNELPARMRARVLLSGHSLTDNPLADYVQHLAERHGRDYGWEQQIIIGSPLRYRTRGPDSDASDFAGYSLGKNRAGTDKDLLQELAMPRAIAASERYDTLVVTERHDVLDVIEWEDTVPLLRHFHDRLREHESSARTLFYQSWPDIDRSKAQAWIDYQSKELAAWECAASKVNLSLQRDNAAASVSVIPVAVVIAKFAQRVLANEVPGLSGGLDAVFMDDVHLTTLGAYVAAAATYSAVFAESAAGVEPPSQVPAPVAAAAAEVAWEVVSSYFRAGEGQWQRSMEDCRTRLSTLCPDYLAIRDRSDEASDCAVWQRSDGPLRWPDPSFPLPAP